jgi:acyl carrier protein
MTDTRAKIRTFLVDNFLFGPADASLDDDASFLELELVDSTGVIELVSFVEESFGIKVQDNEITRENFDSVARLAHFVESKLPAAVSQPAQS